MRVIKDEVVFSSLGWFCPSSLLSCQAEAPLAIASALSHITFGMYLLITHAFTRVENLHPKDESSYNSLCYTKHMISHVFEDLRKRKAPNTPHVNMSCHQTTVAKYRTNKRKHSPNE
jgi:hypothetical protein